MTERYAIRLTKSAEKDLYDLPPKQFKQVVKKIFSLQSNPIPQDCKMLQGYSGNYRVDQGEFRILYWIIEGEIRIFKVGKRNDDEVYRNL